MKRYAVGKREREIVCVCVCVCSNFPNYDSNRIGLTLIQRLKISRKRKGGKRNMRELGGRRKKIARANIFACTTA